jgi:hypothetical protein
MVDSAPSIAHPPDLNNPRNRDELLLQLDSAWPRSKWRSFARFARVLQIYRNYTAGDHPNACNNRYVLGFWENSHGRLFYCLDRLIQFMGRSRSSINSAFLGCHWDRRTLKNAGEWRAELEAAVPRLREHPEEMRGWTFREIERGDGVDSQPGAMWTPGTVDFPHCDTLEFPFP